MAAEDQGIRRKMHSTTTALTTIITAISHHLNGKTPYERASLVIHDQRVKSFQFDEEIDCE